MRFHFTLFYNNLLSPLDVSFQRSVLVIPIISWTQVAHDNLLFPIPKYRTIIIKIFCFIFFVVIVSSLSFWTYPLRRFVYYNALGLQEWMKCLSYTILAWHVKKVCVKPFVCNFVVLVVHKVVLISWTYECINISCITIGNL